MKNHIKDEPLTTTLDNEKKKTTEKMRDESTDNDDNECVEGHQKTRVTSTHIGRQERVCKICGRRR